MWLMLQQDQPDDYVVATGEAHSVLELVQKVFGLLELDWEQYVRIDSRYFRPTEVDLLVGDSHNVRQVLDWKQNLNFDQLVKMMVDADWQLARKERSLEENCALE